MKKASKNKINVWPAVQCEKIFYFTLGSIPLVAMTKQPDLILAYSKESEDVPSIKSERFLPHSLQLNNCKCETSRTNSDKDNKKTK